MIKTSLWSKLCFVFKKNICIKKGIWKNGKTCLDCVFDFSSYLRCKTCYKYKYNLYSLPVTPDITILDFHDIINYKKKHKKEKYI